MCLPAASSTQFPINSEGYVKRRCQEAEEAASCRLAMRAALYSFHRSGNHVGSLLLRAYGRLSNSCVK
jgi:hypothetical protein